MADIHFVSEDDVCELDFDWEKFRDVKRNISFFKYEYVLGAYEDKRVVGRLMFEILSGRSHIRDFIVKKGYRNKGIGTALLRKFEEFSRENGCHKLTAKTTKGNTAIKLYKKIGYKEEFIQKNDAFGWDWIGFCKIL